MKTFLLFLILTFGVALPWRAEAQATQGPSTVWMTSSLAAYGDGSTATAVCGTTAVDPNTKQTSLTGQNNYYAGFSTVCIVRTDPGGVEVSSSLVGCPKATDPSPVLGDNIKGMPASSCTWNFPIIPGQSYRLTSEHYLWLNPYTSYPSGTCTATDAKGFANLSDPLAWYDNVADYIPNGGLPDSVPVPVYPQGSNLPGLTYTDTEDARTQANGSGDEGCYGLDTTVVVANGNSGAWEVAATQAEFTAVGLIGPNFNANDVVPNSDAELYQSQFTSYSANLDGLRKIPEMASDTLQWCLTPTNTSGCSNAGDGMTGRLEVTTNPDDGANSEATFYTPEEYFPYKQEYICAQDAIQPQNFACGNLGLEYLRIKVCPGGFSGLCGALGPYPVSLDEGQNQKFAAAVRVNADLFPAKDLGTNFQTNLTWEPWSVTTVPASTCLPGSQVTWQTEPTVESLNTYLYCAPTNTTGSGAIVANATVVMPDSGGSIVSLVGGLNLSVVSPGQSQTVSFPAIPAQVALTSLALNASSSSTLSVIFYSDAPSVCSVSGTTATMASAGTCTITAIQPGNSSYIMASATQSFTVSHASQTLTFPAIPPQFFNTSIGLVATSNSGLPVVYSTTTSTVCTVAGAVATLSTVGTCTILATQAGNATYLAASARQSFAVSRYVATVSALSSKNPVPFGSYVEFSVGVFGNGPTPTGTVNFYSGTTLLGQQSLSGGRATLGLSTMLGGASTITVQYLGDGNYPAATSTGFKQTISKLTPTVALIPSANPVGANVPFSVTATVVDSSGSGTPGGTIKFYLDGPGVITLTVSNGVAVYQNSGLAAGTHTIAVQYNGDQNYTGVQGVSMHEVVSK